METNSKLIINDLSEVIMTAVDNAISILAPDFKVLYQNSYHKALIGDHRGEYCYKACQRRDKICEGCPAVLSFDDGQTHNIRKSCIAADRRCLPVEITTSPIRDSSGVIIACVEIVKGISKNNISEADLRRSKAREQALLNVIPDMMFLINADGIFLDYKAEQDTLLYAPPEKFLGRSIYEVLPAEVAGRCMQNLKLSLKTGKTQSFEYALPMNGEFLEFEARLVATEDNKVLVIVRDITERKRIEKALKESEEKYRSVFEATGTATAIVEEDMTFSLVNAEFEILSEYSKEELEYRKKWTEFVVPEDVERMRGYHYLRRTGPKATPKNYEFRFVDRNGDIKDIYMTTDIIPGTKKSVASLLDVTARKKFEEGLRLSESKFHALVEQSLVGFYILQDGLFPYMNPKCAEIFGFTADEAISKKSVYDLIIEEDHGIAGEDVRKLLSHEAQTVIDTYRGRRKDGTVIEFEAQGTLTIYNGKPAIIGTVMDITERRRAADVLRHERDFISTILSTIYSLVIVLDLEGKIVRFNHACEHTTGYTFKEVIGRYVWEFLLAPEEVDLVKVVFNNLKVGYFPNKNNNYWIARDGQRRWIAWNNTVLLDNNGEIEYVVSTGMDITEYRQMEESLREQKRFSENIVENSAVATFVLDPRHTVMLWNKACEELTGIPAADMIGTDDQWRAFYDHKRPCLADIVIDGTTHALPALYIRHARSVLRSQGLQAEGWYKNMNGRDRYISFDAAPIYDSKGHLSVVIETLHDITTQKLMEDEREKLIIELQRTLVQVSRSQKEWQDTFDSIADLIFIIKEDFTILRANLAFANNQGLHPREVVGKKCHEIIEGRLSPCEHCPHKAALYEKKQITIECLNPGTNKILSVSVYPFFSPEGDLIGSIHIARDVTIEKENERKLIMSERLASLGQLSAGMAHEINNPINFILANTQMLREIWDDVLKILQKHYEEQDDFIIGGFSFLKNRERITKLFPGIVEGANRIKNIVANLKVFTRAKTIEHERPVDINKIIRTCLMILESQIDSFTDRFIVDMEEDLPMVKGNSHNLEQVISNLIMNALQSLPDKTCGARLSVLFDRGGNCIIIQVRDEGTGMSKEVMEKACFPFFTTKRESGGIGLGLSICRSIIDDHGGSLEFASKPGEGTTATVKLPLMLPVKGGM